MGKTKLGEFLIAEGKIDAIQLKSALGFQKRWGRKLGECFVHLGHISELDLCHALSRALHIPMVDLSRLDPSKLGKEILSKLSIRVARDFRAVPIAIKKIHRRERLVIATSDPTGVIGLVDELGFKWGLPVLVMIAPDSDIEWFIRKFYLGESAALSVNYISKIDISRSPNQTAPLTTNPEEASFWEEHFNELTDFRTRLELDKKRDK